MTVMTLWNKSLTGRQTGRASMAESPSEPMSRFPDEVAGTWIEGTERMQTVYVGSR